MKFLPNILSVSRAMSAVAILFFPVFSATFWALYFWGGLSDMIDGPVARRMGAESELGSRIDSLADIVFLASSCLLLLPFITLPAWLWLWAAVIATVKTAAICVVSCRRRQPSVPHTLMNKLTGFLLFFLPLAMIRLNALVPAVFVCLAATLSLLEDITLIRRTL